MNVLDLAGLDITDADEPVAARLRVSTLSEPPGASDLFATPSSSASGSTGGGKVGTTLGLLLVSDILDVCGGVISGAGHSVMRFCTKPSGACHTKGHRSKVLLKGNTFYIKHTRAGQARFEPSLARSFLPEELEAADLLGKEKAFVEWSAYFGGLQAKRLLEQSPSSGGSMEAWEKIETPILEAFSQANRSLKTPKRLRLGSLLAVDVETLPMPEERQEHFSTLEAFAVDVEDDFLDSKIQNGLRTVFAEWNRLESMFHMIHLRFNGTATGEQKYREAVQKTMLEMQGSIREADARIQVLHAAIGQDLEASEEDTISVWEAIGAVKKGLDEVTGSSDSNAEFLIQARNSLPGLIDNLAKLSSHYMTNMPIINQALATSRNRIAILESGTRQQTDMFGLNVASASSGEDHGAAIQHVRSALELEIAGLRTSVATLSQEGGGFGAAAGGRPDLDVLTTEIVERLGSLEARSSGEGFASGDHVFNSVTSVSEWLVAERVPNAGCFWDLFSVLACMSPKRQRGKEKADETYSAKRINSTQLDNDLLAAMTHERPDVLYAKRVGGELGALEDGFIGCPSYKDWITGTESYRAKLTKDLRQFCTAVEGSMPKGVDYRSLALSLIGDVKTQWSTMCSFIDSFYIELTGVANFPKDKAWKLTGRCVAAVFTAMGSYRASVSRLDDLVSLENKSACIWGVMQCHRVVTEFETVDYRGHPGVVTEMNLFLLIERIDPTIIVQNETKIKQLESENKAVTSELKRVTETCAGLKRDFTNLNTAVAALRTKVNKP
jgi:hypothetical protein